MPVAAGTAVVGWMGAAGASAGVAAAAGAVATAVVSGAIVGAVVGAGVAIVSGEDPLKGALRGGLIGGVSGGVMKGVGMGINAAMSTGTSTATNVGTSAAVTPPPVDVAQKIGESANNAAQGATTTNTVANTTGQAAQNQGLLSKTMGFFGGSAKDLTDSEKLARSNVMAGIGQGVFEGISNVGAAKISSDEAKELAQWKEKQIALNRANNRPGEFKASELQIKLPDRWNANLKRKGLLA